MRTVPFTVTLSCAFALACGDNIGPGGRKLNILSTNFASDTVGSSQSYELEVQVLTANGEAAAGVHVEFTAVGAQFDPRVVFLVGGRDFMVAVDTTDQNGRASALVRPSGVKAGRADVVVAAPALGLQNTAYYDLLPGKPVSLAQIEVRAGLMVGDTFTIRGTWYDRNGNRSQSWEPIVCSSAAPEITLTGCKVTGTAMGPVAIEVRPVANPQVVHTTQLAVVPRAQIAFNGAGGVTLANLDGTNPRSLGNNYVPSDWYKAGDRFLAFAPMFVPPQHLYVIDVNGNATEWSAALRSSAGEQDPELAPDEQWVYFAANLSANSGSEIWRARVNGSNAQRLGPPSTGNRRDRSPSVSPDGLQVVYASNSNLQVLDLATGAVRSLGTQGDAPIWSPIGEWIAFAGQQGLSVIRPDGSSRTILIPSMGSAGTPTFGNHSPTDWSPDGKYLIGQRTYGATSTGLFVMEVTSGKLVYPNVAASNAIWRPVN